MKNFIQNNLKTLLAGILGFFILATLVVGFIVVPIIKQNKSMQFEYLQEQLRIENYEKCMDEAYEVYNYDWNQACDTLGKEYDCTLPAYRANVINDWKEQKENLCLQMYK